MKNNRVDYFFDKQPPLLFVEELRKPLHTGKPKWFFRTEISADEVCVQGAFLLNTFPDEEKLLETATEDFNVFLSLYGIAYPTVICPDPNI